MPDPHDAREALARLIAGGDGRLYPDGSVIMDSHLHENREAADRIIAAGWLPPVDAPPVATSPVVVPEPASGAQQAGGGEPVSRRMDILGGAVGPVERERTAINDPLDGRAFAAHLRGEVERLRAALAERDAVIAEAREALMLGLLDPGAWTPDVIRAALARIDAMKGGE